MRYEDKPHARLQWKGTFEVCVDIFCDCGEASHYDGDSFYCVKCPYCGKVYYCSPYIELVELPKLDNGDYTFDDTFFIREPEKDKEYNNEQSE